MLASIFLCIMKSYLFAMFVWNFTTTSLSIAEILLFIKRWSKNPVANIANNNACVMLTYARQGQCTVRQRLTQFLHKQKQNGSLISREDRMLIKVLHQ